MEQQYFDDAKKFAELLKNTVLKSNTVSFGSFLLPFKQGVVSTIQYNNYTDFDMLDNKHEYTFPTKQGEIQMSMQLYMNYTQHYRLFAFTRVENKQGLTFSINLTTEKDSDGVIFLTQKIKFSERIQAEKNTANLRRRLKQRLLCDIYRKMGLEVTENNDLILGVFDPNENKFINTSSEAFLNNYIAVSILKGHFQGNKGYSLEIIPDYENDNDLVTHEKSIINDSKLPIKIAKQKQQRSIPLAFRYKVLKRDNSKCVACGRSVADGAILHIDHKLPYSLGGLTELNNLQTLCSDCNISKSNRFID